MKRRRFLAIAAAASLAGPAAAAPVRWDGLAFGGDVSVTIRGGRAADAALRAVVGDIRRIERKFSLFDPDSDLSRLNRTGAISMDADWRVIVQHVDNLHRATDGIFDPTVQPLWRLMASTSGTPGEAAWREAKALLGWNRVRHVGGRLQLDRGQALTLNGIAQGFASDLIAERLHLAGFDEVLVDLGEFRAGRAGQWRVGIDGLPDRMALRNSALAISAPGAMRFGADVAAGHIFDATGPAPRPARWRLAAVHAGSAAVADGLSTGFALMEADAIRRAMIGTCRQVLLVSADGDELRLDAATPA
ncbi:FAD:protein FMN transferase [Paracoccus xiamenensis]|uniref:FAD:protein FMN transferase n=1 Tax=Paracoccus xiamenensis TaxID=2714901 RepID=UPI00140875AB|nr:FAD:protein FMN transferase [Paracoccus xiamenensis]NHF74482.1 FAD:protein FMN transferase [Paracoccus xiamenensis]